MSLLPSSIASLHFLVVDDFQSMRVVLSAQLKHLGVSRVSFATSGNEAFKLIKEAQITAHPVQFVITDLMMKNGSGIDLTRLVRADAALAKLPILMISSMNDMDQVLEAVKTGVSDYIVKPWQEADLIKKITSCAPKAPAK